MLEPPQSHSIPTHAPRNSCPICNFAQKNNRPPTQHIASHSGVFQSCEYCGKSGDIRSHFQRGHCYPICKEGNIGRAAKLAAGSKCPKCDVTISNPSYLTKHIKSHSGIIRTCEYCNFESDIKGHFLVGKPNYHNCKRTKAARAAVIHNCSKCDFTSNSASATASHERTHTGQFVTCVCGFKSDIPSCFNSRSKNYHRCAEAKAARAAAIYSCSKCDFTGSSASATTSHEKAHTGQFVTCVCGFKSDIKGHFNSSSRNYHRCEQGKAARAANSYSISTSSSTSSSSSAASPKLINHSTNASAASRRRLGAVIDLQISDQTINESNHLVDQNKAIRQHLHPYKTLQDDFECDGCNNLFKKDTVLYGCVSCDHDLCDDCLRQAIESPLEWKESVFCSALAVKNRKRSRSNSNDSLLSPPFKKQKKIKDKYKGMSKQERREARRKNNERIRLNKMRNKGGKTSEKQSEIGRNGYGRKKYGKEDTDGHKRFVTGKKIGTCKPSCKECFKTSKKESGSIYGLPNGWSVQSTPRKSFCEKTSVYITAVPVHVDKHFFAPSGESFNSLVAAKRFVQSNTDSSSSSSTTSSASPPPTSASNVSTGVTPAHLSFTLAQMSDTDEEGESDWL
jgi:hypothetical protein